MSCPMPGFESRAVQSVTSRYTGYAIPAPRFISCVVLRTTEMSCNLYGHCKKTVHTTVFSSLGSAGQRSQQERFFQQQNPHLCIRCLSTTDCAGVDPTVA